MAQGIRTSTRPTRRREMDLMGMLIVVGLVFFHSAQIFSGTGHYVENTQQGMAVGIAANLFLAFGSMWGVPLMMLIAGTAIWYDIAVRRTWSTRFLFGLRPGKTRS